MVRRSLFPKFHLNIMSRLNLLSVGIILLMTAGVLGAGTLIIGDTLYRFQEQVLRRELDNARQQIVQALSLSGAKAAAEQAAGLHRDLRGKEGLKSVRLFVLENPDQRVVFHPMRPAGYRSTLDFVATMFERGDGTIEYVYQNMPSYAVFTTVPSVNWLIGISISKDEMLSGRNEFLRTVGGVTLLVLFLNALAINVFGRRLLARIKTTLECVRRIEGGDVSARIAPVALMDELGHLQAGINAMGAGIEERTLARQRAEQALRDNRALLQSILDYSNSVIFVKDLEGRYLLVNRRFSELFHLSLDDVRDKTVYDMFPAEQAAPIRAAELQAVTGRCAVQVEDIVPQDDGLHTYLAVKYPLYNDSGEPYAVCGISTDITERKHAESERQGRLAAETANRTKSEFLAAMSHELRTPLNAILGYAQLLQHDAALLERQSESVASIIHGGQHLLALINDLLDMARIETRKFELSPAPMRLAGFLKSVANIVRMCAEDKNLTFAVDAAPDLPTVVTADEKRLRQVAINLLDNAVKFTPQGSVTLRVSCLKRGEGRALLRFEVVDTGVGMSPEQLATLFHPFDQVGERPLRATGPGLGLSISRDLVRLMGGDVVVESEPGAGSRFWFDVDLAEQDDSATLPKVGSPPALQEENGDSLGPTEVRQAKNGVPGAANDGVIGAIPPHDEIEVLHELAKAGNMRAIREWSDRIAGLDAGYLAFAERLQDLAKNYQSRAILKLVEGLSHEEGAP